MSRIALPVVAVDLGSLWALGFGVARVVGRRREAWRSAWRPLALYLAVTLPVPLLRGAGARPAFWEHAAAGRAPRSRSRRCSVRFSRSRSGVPGRVTGSEPRPTLRRRAPNPC